MKTRVLLVDDEKDFLEIMAERLSARGMEVATSTSAEDAVELVAHGTFDAVIMDLMMPAMDGFKALKLLKTIRPEVSIILLTGEVPRQKIVEALDLGALDVIEKPADLDRLTRKIKQAKTLKNKKLNGSE